MTAFLKVRQAARGYIESITAAGLDTVSPPALPIFDQLHSMGLKEIVTVLDIQDEQRTSEDIVILNYVLEKGWSDGDAAAEDDANCEKTAAVVLRNFVSHSILPTQAFAARSPFATDEKPAMAAKELAKYHSISFSGLLALASLEKMYPISNGENEDLVALLTCLSSFTDTSDPWTSEFSNKAALEVLDTVCHRQELGTFSGVLSDLLRERIKPAFARSKNSAVTQQGRKAVYPAPEFGTDYQNMDAENTPWKYRDAYIVTVLGWIIDSLDLVDLSFIDANWPLLIPPLLALVDDTSITIKSKGSSFVKVFLRKVPPPLLYRTGLGEVFENNLKPCLNYLPPMTEESESLRLLEHVYPALINLAHVQYPGDKQRAERISAMDRVLRDGVLKGYAQAGEHVKVANLLVRQMEKLMEELGIDSVKYLKYVVPLLSRNLAAPFASAYPPLLQTTLRALQATMLTAWPRIVHYRGEILQGLAICWCRLEEQGDLSVELEAVVDGIQRTAGVLTSLLRHDVNVLEEYQMILESDGRLQRFLAV